MGFSGCQSGWVLYLCGLTFFWRGKGLLELYDCTFVCKTAYSNIHAYTNKQRTHTTTHTRADTNSHNQPHLFPLVMSRRGQKTHRSTCGSKLPSNNRLGNMKRSRKVIKTLPGRPGTGPRPNNYWGVTRSSCHDCPCCREHHDMPLPLLSLSSSHSFSSYHFDATIFAEEDRWVSGRIHMHYACLFLGSLLWVDCRYDGYIFSSYMCMCGYDRWIDKWR